VKTEIGKVTDLTPKGSHGLTDSFSLSQHMRMGG